MPVEQIELDCSIINVTSDRDEEVNKRLAIYS